MKLIQLDPALAELQSAARRFADTIVRPRAAAIDAAGEYPQDIFQAARDADLLGLAVPVEYGGSGAGVMGLCLAVEEVTRYCQSSGLILLLSRLASGPLMLAPDGPRFESYIRRVASGAARGAFCLTEPEAGSDVSAMRTRAVAGADGYQITGRKCYISGATVADFFIVWARTEGSGGSEIAGFLVDRGLPGVSIGHVDAKMGVRGVPTAEVLLDAVNVSAGHRLSVPGRGFAHLMAALNSARPVVAARGLGLVAGALDCAVRYARERSAFGQKIIDHEAVQFMIADMAMRLEAAKALVYGAARLVDDGHAGKEAAGYIAMAKCFAADLAVQASADCLQIHGAAGYMCDLPLERYYRDAKQLQIVEGTSQIQRMIIGRAVRDGFVAI